jgi:UDP-glucose 4-epimerase
VIFYVILFSLDLNLNPKIYTTIGRNGVHIFNLGTGQGATVLEVIQAFSQASGKVRITE